MRDVAEWLDALGLGKYAENFAENDVGPDVLPDLTEGHLKELQVSLGDRVRLLKAIEALQGPPPKPLKVRLPQSPSPMRHSPPAKRNAVS